jgi:cobalt-zinc-cadmium efflux system outer membrane protein
VAHGLLLVAVSQRAPASTTTRSAAWLVPLMVLVTLPAGGPAIAAESHGLTLAQARRLAAERGWSLLAAASDLHHAEGLRLQARSWPNPTLSISAQKLNVTPVGEGGSTSDSTLAVAELFELGGKRADRIRSAEAAVKAARRQLSAVRVAVDALVVKAYANALAADETARVSQESADSLVRAASIAQARFSAGEISAAERDQMRVAAGRFALDARTAAAVALQSRVALEGLLGVPAPDGRTDLAEDLASLARRAVEAGASLTPATDAAALDGRGDVQSARALVEQAVAQLGLQRAQRVPDLSLFVQYESDRPANTNTLGAGVSLSLPIFDRSRGSIAAAESAREQARDDARRVRAQAAAELSTARALLGAAFEKQRRYRDELLPSAESVQATVAFSYERGRAALLEVLEAERSLNEVRLATVASEAEAVAAAADLAAARGETLP